ncbi:MAG: transporter substrate-binding protein [Paenibacillaceae bacterium]|jgi:multiple sugar transport system substrate-binding protein|nr:transporter substrate-binding protein [Paenibacillaceae bacterium]
MKTATAASALLSLSILAAGCGSTAESGSTPSASQAPAGSAPSSSQITEISFITHSNWEKPLTKVIDEFQKENPQIKVNVQFNPYAKLMETNEVKLAAKATDLDVVTVDVPLNANYTVKGYLEPLDAWFKDSDRQVWVDSAIAAATYQGKLMTVPMNSSGTVLFYNKELLAKDNVAFPSEKLEERLTWEQVIELARKLTHDDVYGFSVDQVGRAYQLLPFIQSKKGEVLDQTGLVTTGYTNSPASIEALTFYYDLFNTWKVSPKIKREEAPDYFTSGKVALFLSNTANLNKIEASGISYGIAPHPYFAGGEIATPTGSLNLGISKYSSHKEEAAKFIRYVSSGKGAQILFEESGQLPALKSLLDRIDTDAKYSELPGSVLRLVSAESKTTAAPRPLTPGYLEWESNFNKALEDIKNGTAPKKALDDAASLIDAQLRKYSSAAK